MNSDRRKMDQGRTEALTPEGMTRRESMLGELQAEVVRTASRRRTRRVALRTSAVCTLIVVATTAILTLKPASPVRTPPGEEGHIADTGAHKNVLQPDPRAQPNDASSVFARTEITIVRTEPGASDPYIVRTNVDISEYALSDDEFLDALADAGKRTGMVRTNGRTWLTTNVADDPDEPMGIDHI